MPHANRYYAPGCVWHITHRCHGRYHATAVDIWVYALRCATYIAMNMVRAGVVGGEAFVGEVRQMLQGVRATWKLAACGNGDGAVLKEPDAAYNAVFGGENSPLTLFLRPLCHASN